MLITVVIIMQYNVYYSNDDDDETTKMMMVVVVMSVLPVDKNDLHYVKITAARILVRISHEDNCHSVSHCIRLAAHSQPCME